MDAQSTLGRAVASAARTINQTRSLDQTLQVMADVAQDSLPGFDQVGISLLLKNGDPDTRATTGHLVPELDALQYGLSEGPCVDTLRGRSVVAAPSLRHEQRWPRYVPKAIALGVRSQLAVRLYLDELGTLGGLNLYSTTSEEIDPEAESIAELFAAHASIALGHATEREQLNDALQSRKVIGQALGIVMERYDLSEDRAFAFLVRASSHSNNKLRNVAQAIVDDRNEA